MLEGFRITCRDNLIADYEGNGSKQGNENEACAYVHPTYPIDLCRLLDIVSELVVTMILPTDVTGGGTNALPGHLSTPRYFIEG